MRIIDEKWSPVFIVLFVRVYTITAGRTPPYHPRPQGLQHDC